jgi:hypothetical protein
MYHEAQFSEVARVPLYEDVRNVALLATLAICEFLTNHDTEEITSLLVTLSSVALWHPELQGETYILSYSLAWRLDDQGSGVKFLAGVGNFSLRHRVQIVLPR